MLIQQFTREGAWITQYYMHFRTANEFLKIARLAETEYQREWKRLSMEHDDESYVGHILRELEHKITRYATASEVFCCLSIEAFINFYGTVRLGETTYLRKFERLSITSKLTSLMVACESKTVPQNHPTMKIIKKTFRIRNRIVHPGTTEITHQKEPDVSTPIEVINEAEGVNLDTINFFKHFSDLDRNVDWKSVLWMNDVTWED